ncbi:oxidoreductase [Pleomorphomonas diazotrophica]|uniref:Oxidoreductase n=1 Tax=Pleomorphomonas diazotrophica TaxID=1166257 RepID=A0A1I4TQW3_9HYPH|nr:Gfo/Idh/MocA family oxidoreductase [Pleomorphomonas diazotrophica]PKR87614.1 oxidoreductase [Pleomorphomonas diazotrophica]SFM79020.1 Predicted dehydrogenase [Pleomorphomonas diazotrophica]
MTIEASSTTTVSRRLRLGMVGGGRGAFIGAVHRIAARLDDRYELVAGALSSDPERARASAADLHIAPDRAYSDFKAMAKAEAARPDGIDVVAIVTPNHMHAPIATAFLNAGIHVICDKPMTRTVAEAEALATLVADTGLIFVLTHNYSGYPMIRQARSMVAAGELGPIRLVQVEYPQDWLTVAAETMGSKQAEWRTDPARSGLAGSVGDIGSHAMQLAEYVSGLQCEALMADLTTFVPGRRLDDNAGMLLRFAGGARGMLWCSQVAPGNANALRLRIYGERAGLEWAQETPNELALSPFGEPTRTITRSGPGANAVAAHASRIPGGHPEGYLEAFAQIYADAAELILARLERRSPDPAALVVPTVGDGVRGVRFINAAVASSQANAAWTRIADV